MSHTSISQPSTISRLVRRALAGLAGLVAFLSVLAGPGTAFAYTDRNGTDSVAGDPAPVASLSQPVSDTSTQPTMWIGASVALVIIAALAVALIVTTRRLSQQRRGFATGPARA